MRALVNLGHLKRIEFSDEQLQAWADSLQYFPPDVVELACVKLAGDRSARFVEFGDLMSHCQRIHDQLRGGEYLVADRDYDRMTDVAAAWIKHRLFGQ